MDRSKIDHLQGEPSIVERPRTDQEGEGREKAAQWREVGKANKPLASSELSQEEQEEASATTLWWDRCWRDSIF